MAFFILATYALFSSMWWFYITDGDVRELRQVMAGAMTAGIGVWIALFLAKRKKDDRNGP